MLRFICLGFLDAVCFRDSGIVRSHNMIKGNNQQALKNLDRMDGEHTGMENVFLRESHLTAYGSLHSSCNLSKMS